MTERVLDMLGTKLRERDLPDYESYDAEKRDFLFSTYRGLAQFVSENDPGATDRIEGACRGRSFRHAVREDEPDR